MTAKHDTIDYAQLSQQIKTWGLELGFQQVGICDTDLQEHEGYLQQWLQAGYHGQMEYMHRHGSKRSHPQELVNGTIRIISVRMDYWPEDAADAESILKDPATAYISRYALGRDYHKVLRSRLKKLAQRIEQSIGTFAFRVFVDSAPVMEKALAEKSGIGWIGKHTNIIHDKAGSWFFLGELYTDIPLPVDTPAQNHCGNCQSCIDVCPTQAIIAPYKLDARRCISYLTIELRGPIPVELRPLLGNRIYGCDDCQIICPWNRFARPTEEGDFSPRQQLDTATLIELFNWDEQVFLQRTEGSAIRRIGYECWMRNIAVALGNCKPTEDVIHALRDKIKHDSELIREHTLWALQQHDETADSKYD
jgi:epoxyqueuosine reductase